MPLPPSPQRRPLHHRKIDLQVYEREDGLYDVEAQLLDTKTQPFRRVMPEAEIPAGTPLHDIRVRLVIDFDLQVHEVIASSDTTPYPVCKEATATLAPLKGLGIGAGWNSRVRELLRGAASCTHLAELMGPMATAAIQALLPLHRERRPLPVDAQGRPRQIDSCYAYAAEREVVAYLWPQHHRAGQQNPREPS